MRRWWAVLALSAASVVGAWSLASASVLEVDGGILQTWQLGAELHLPEPPPSESGATESQPTG